MTQATLIIGGGAAGVLLARRLCRSTDHVILVDPSEQPGAGPAYGRAAPWHLLNSPAATMSVEPDQPEHFLAWAAAAEDSPISPGDFVPRSLYGRYLRAMLTDAVDTGRLQIIRANVTSIRGDGDRQIAQLDTGDTVAAADVVLAVGNPVVNSPVPGLADHPRYIADPWRSDAFDAVGPGPVLLIGAGLTAVDVALSIAVLHPDVRVDAISRHGLIPRSHRPADETASVQTRTPAPVTSLAQLLAAIRRSVAHTGDWRAVMDGLRPRVDQLWQGLDTSAQQRFLEHGARYWEIHRHRMAPQIAGRVDQLRAAGRLTVAADRIVAVDPTHEDHIGVAFAHARTRNYTAVVNCTGPGKLPAGANPLVAQLLADGRARTEPHRMGLDVDDSGRLRNADGTAHRHLWVVGALRRGRLWETTAVPEIRQQASDVAASIVGAPADHGRINSA